MINEEFFDGFMKGSGIEDRNQAKEQWANWTRQLGDRERDEIESDGYNAGFKEGQNAKYFS